MGAPNLDVGRYAIFIWPAYGVSALVLLGLVADSLLRAARWRRAAETEHAPGRNAPERNAPDRNAADRNATDWGAP